MRLLRDKAGLTRLLLLHEMERTTHTRLQGLADRVGITVQGVSNYVGEMEREGLARAARGRYELTPAGRQVLQEGLGELKAWVDLAYTRAGVIELCAARAATRVRAGDPLGLFMEGGVLVARARRASPSRGVAVEDAAPGDLVRVRALEGLVTLRPAKLTVLNVPAAPGGKTRAAAAALRRWVAREKPGCVAAAGTEAQVLALAAKLSPILFAPAQAAHHAAQLGVRAVVLAGPGQARFVTAALDALDEDAPDPVRHEARSLQVKP